VPDSEPSLSIITPSLNHSAYIRMTIQSVFDEGYPNVEHIVVDGGSTDGTVEILGEYGQRYPGRFRWVSEPDSGQGDAFNKGLAMARGDVIGWQNSDDYYLPGAFAGPLDLMRTKPDVAVVYSSCVTVDASGHRTGQGLLPTGVFDAARLLGSCYISNQAAFVRRDALLAVGGLDTSLRYVMDWDLWLRLAPSHQFQYLPGVRGAYRILPTAKTHEGLLASRLEGVRIVDRALTAANVPTSVTAAGRISLQQHLLDALQIALALGEQRHSREVLRRLASDYGSDIDWRYFCRRLQMRRVMTDLWYGRVESDSVSPVPIRALRLLDEFDNVGRCGRRRLVALTMMFAAMDELAEHAHGPSLRAFPYVVRALQADRAMMSYPGTYVAMLRLLLGNGAVDRLAPLFLTMRTLGAMRQRVPWL